MDEQFIIKDSGVREEYPSGMRRDTQTGKPDYTLCWEPMLTRWAMHLTKGAEKYGRHNWQKANSKEEFERFQSSALRHLMQWMRGERDEDHAAAVFFNIAAAEFVLTKIDNPFAAEEKQPSPPPNGTYTEVPPYARPWSYGGCMQ